MLPYQIEDNIIKPMLNFSYNTKNDNWLPCCRLLQKIMPITTTVMTPSTTRTIGITMRESRALSALSLIGRLMLPFTTISYVPLLAVTM